MGRVGDDLGGVGDERVVPGSRESEETGGDVEGRDLELEVDGVEFGEGRAERVADGDHCKTRQQERGQPGDIRDEEGEREIDDEVGRTLVGAELCGSLLDGIQDRASGEPLRVLETRVDFDAARGSSA